MKKFSKFHFKKFEFNRSDLKAKFHYSFDNEIFFEEVIDFDSWEFNLRDDLNDKTINNILFHIHIALWISYYKAFPTKDLIVESGFLDDAQILFWKKFYLNWLWEFLFTNKINPNNLFNFAIASEIKYVKKNFKTSNKSLVALGWWKDSIVSMELLSKAWLEYDLCVFWKNDNLKLNVAEVAWKNILLINRQISPVLFKLNDKWYYNWHVPITWIIAFILELTSYLYDYKYIVLSNEKSANFWNTNWEWFNINHQYSKSLEFEKDFKKYVENYISSDVKYFSLLRWFYELKIAELFSKLWKKYFWVFSSCNKNFKILKEKKEEIWCNSCPKCLFVFSVLRPYITNKEVLKIFWKDLFFEENLENSFRELLWIKWIKPFECVWEAEEVIYSMYKSINKYDSKKLPYILNIFKKEVLNKFSNDELIKLEKKFGIVDEDDIIPSEIKKLIFKNK